MKTKLLILFAFIILIAGCGKSERSNTFNLSEHGDSMLKYPYNRAELPFGV